MRAAIYARYSTDFQSASSIEDQISAANRVGRRLAMTDLGPYARRAPRAAPLQSGQNDRRRTGLSAILLAEG
jgi:hypothetical protein